MERTVSNQRLQQFCTDHTADITRLLQALVAKFTDPTHPDQAYLTNPDWRDE